MVTVWFLSDFSPHLCVGFLFLVLYPAASSSFRLLRLPPLTCHHTTCSHTTRPHTTCSHTTCPHTTCHHTTCPHTTCPHTTCPHASCPHTTCPHNLLTHNLSSPNRLHTPCAPSLCVAGVVLVLTQLVLTKSLTHHLSTFTLRGRRGTCPHTTCPHQIAYTQVVHLHFAWQAWYLSSHNLYTHNLSSPNRLHTTCPPSFHVAGVKLGDIDLHFAWQVWHLWHWTGSGGALGPEWTRWSPRLLAWQAWHLETSTFVSRGRRGTHVAGVVLGDIGFHFALQACHLWHWTGSGGALGPEWTRWSPRLLAWQAWHLETSTVVSRGRRGDIHLRFTWQARYLATSTSTLRGRCGTW